LVNQVALEKLKHYCAYQERCHQEVRGKLLKLKVYGEDLEEVISALISENYLNEERFAKSFVSGKFRIKKWGRYKITQELKKRKISAYCIKKGLEEIDEEEYEGTLTSLLNNYWEKNSNYPKPQRHKKAIAYMQSKGYEIGLILKQLNELFIKKGGGKGPMKP